MPLIRAVRVCRASVQTAGHLSCIAILQSSQILSDVLRVTTRLVVRVISTLTGAKIEQDYQPMHRERFISFQKPLLSTSGSGNVSDVSTPHELLSYVLNTGGNGKAAQEPFQLLDERETLRKVKKYYLETVPSMLKKSGEDESALTPFEANIRKNIQNPGPHFGDEQNLKELACTFISAEFGCLNPELLAEDFQFLFPVVGPLGKADFVEAFSAFQVKKAFPNARANFYNFNVDPLEPNRIWALSRGAYVQEGPLFFGMTLQAPTAKKQINLPPQMFSWSFDGEGKCYKMTGGYCVDRTCGDTDGLGGMFGVLRGMGTIVSKNLLPFPEGQPWNAWTRSCGWDAWSMHLPQIVKDWRNAMK